MNKIRLGCVKTGIVQPNLETSYRYATRKKTTVRRDRTNIPNQDANYDTPSPPTAEITRKEGMQRSAESYVPLVIKFQGSLN